MNSPDPAPAPRGRAATKSAARPKAEKAADVAPTPDRCGSEAVATEPAQAKRARKPASKQDKAAPAPSEATAVKAMQAPKAAKATPRKAKVAPTAPLLDLADHATAPAPQVSDTTKETASPAVPVAAMTAPVLPPTGEARYPRRAPPEPVMPRRTAPPPIERPTAVEPERSQPARRAVDMAELAERQRQMRMAAKQGDRDTPLPQRPAPVSMQERALRYRPASPDADAPQRPPQVPVEPSESREPAAPRQPAVEPRRDPSDGLARALEVSRHKRETTEPMAVAPHAEHTPSAAGMALVVVTRNHAARIESQLSAWRAQLPEADVRWVVLDLGSTDDTVAQVEGNPLIRLVHRPGGLVEPARTLSALLQQLPVDVAVVVDGDAAPSAVVANLLQAIREGAALAQCPQKYPSMLAISRTHWVRDGQPDLRDLRQWALRHGGILRVGPQLGMPHPHSLVQRLLPQRKRKRDAILGLLPTQLRAVLEQLRTLLGR